MRFFRGISVPASEAATVVKTIKAQGMGGNQGQFWSMEYFDLPPLEELFAKDSLSIDDVIGKGMVGQGVCACGEPDGAGYYAWDHNRSATNDTPIVIEFEADADLVAVDGRDFLFTAFQYGNPELTRPILSQAFGAAVLRYAERAWSTPDQQERVALCHLARHDPEVVSAHHDNTLVIGGRYGTVFRSAFIAKLPVPAEDIIQVSVPAGRSGVQHPDVFLSQILAPMS